MLAEIPISPDESARINFRSSIDVHESDVIAGYHEPRELIRAIFIVRSSEQAI